MKIHEYQAKQILKQFAVPIQEGKTVNNANDINAAIAKIQKHYNSKAVVIKAQIHAGGRGKGGGVKYCADTETAQATGRNILGMQLVTPQTGPAGQLVRQILVCQAIDIEKEYYLAITLDRSRGQDVIIASSEGGVEIEEVARTNPEKIVKVWIDPAFGLQPFQCRHVVGALGLTGAQAKAAMKMVGGLYRAYCGTDASIAEINPLVVSEQGELIALDAKFNFDDNALFRHKDIAAMRDLDEEDAAEVEAAESSLNYIKLDGNVGCMVNGAGLAMATMDIIQLKGGDPANFLDVGGGASAETVRDGFRIILGDANVKTILVNIFGGIVRCDRVANGIVAAVKDLALDVPVVVRLAGTNAEEAKAILAESGVDIVPASSLDEAAGKAVALAS